MSTIELYSCQVLWKFCSFCWIDLTVTRATVEIKTNEARSVTIHDFTYRMIPKLGENSKICPMSLRQRLLQAATRGLRPLALDSKESKRISYQMASKDFVEKLSHLRFSASKFDFSSFEAIIFSCGNIKCNFSRLERIIKLSLQTNASAAARAPRSLLAAPFRNIS